MGARLNPDEIHSATACRYDAPRAPERRIYCNGGARISILNEQHPTLQLK